MFNQGLARGELPESMKASVTRLVHKKDDKRLLKNWRPISLLNVDYKICSKAVSLRLSRVLGSIVDPDQTCSVPGRSIHSNFFGVVKRHSCFHQAYGGDGDFVVIRPGESL